MSIDELVLAISEWASAALPGTEVEFRSLAAPAPRAGVFLSVVGFRALRDRRNAMPRRDPVIDLLEVELILQVADEDPMVQASKVADLQFAAMGGGPCTVADPTDARSLFDRLEITPGSGLLLRGEIARRRAINPVPLVREAAFELTDLSGTPAPANGQSAKQEDVRKAK